MFDVNRDGHLPSYMLREVMRTLGYSLTDKQLLDLVDTVDVDGQFFSRRETQPAVITHRVDLASDQCRRRWHDFQTTRCSCNAHFLI